MSEPALKPEIDSTCTHCGARDRWRPSHDVTINQHVEGDWQRGGILYKTIVAVYVCDACEEPHYSEAQLRRGWRVYRRELTDHAERSGGRPGIRPWTWWVFDRRFEDEPDPSTAVAYLAEHGLLTAWEREALAGSI